MRQTAFKAAILLALFLGCALPSLVTALPQRSPRKPHPAGVAPLPGAWIKDGAKPDSGFGFQATAAGDLNGDDFADVMVSEQNCDPEHGRVAVYYGAPTGLKREPDMVFLVQHHSEQPLLIAKAGDVNGDGFDDVLISSIWQQASEPRETGYAQLLLGSSRGLNTEPAWRSTDQPLDMVTIFRVAGVGDVNGDGFADIAFAGPCPQLFPKSSSAVMVFYGSRQGPGRKPDWIMPSEQQSSQIGMGLNNIAAAGDVNGDGYGDLLLGDSRHDGVYTNAGKIYVYYGSRQGLSPVANWSAAYDLPARKDVDEAYDQCFGDVVSSAGDVNGDGFGDVIAGACYADHGDLNEGLVLVFHGSKKGLSQKPDWIAESNQAHALFGWHVAGIGDVNGDGFSEVLIGAPYTTDGTINEGAAALYYGSRNGLNRLPRWSVESDHYEAKLGAWVSAAGDVNGDGFADFLVSAPNLKSESGHIVGRVMLFYGRPGEMPGNFHWRVDKPWLVAIQQRLNLWQIYWGGWTYVIVSLVVTSPTIILFWLRQAHLRRRIAGLLEENRRLAAIEEREALARDMHDHLGANLNQIVLWSELTRTAVNKPEMVSQHLGRISWAAQSALNHIGELVHILKPGNESLENFAGQLAELVQNDLLPTGIHLELDFPDALPELELDARVRTGLAASLKEMLRNVVKHAHATRVVLRLRVEQDHLHLSVSDNGKGFSPPPDCPAPPGGRPGRNGHGLCNLKARAADLGGRLVLESRIGQGSTISIIIPLA